MTLPPRRPWYGSQQKPGQLPKRPHTLERAKTPQSRTHQRPMSKAGQWGLVLLFVVLVGGLGGLGYGLYVYYSVSSVVSVPPPPEVRNEPLPDIQLEPFNMLLLGVDYRSADPSEGARSDTMLLVHVDPQAKSASMLSIPRDSYAYIPHKESYERINAAYSYGYTYAAELYQGAAPDTGGAYLARDAIERFLNLKAHGTRIHYQAQIDFRGFKQVIDAIGGIEVDVPRPLLDPMYPSDDGDNGYLRLYIPAGLQHMDGTTALRYARSRHTESDFGRTTRQQYVLKAILQTLKAQGVFDQLSASGSILDVVKDSVRTDLPIGDPSTLRALLSLASTLSGDALQSYSLHKTVKFDEIRYMLHWNEQDLTKLVNQWLRGPNAAALPSIQVQNGSGVPGVARIVSSYLEQQGYTTQQPADAPSEQRQSTLIINRASPEAQAALLKLLGLPASAVQPATAPLTAETPDVILIVGSADRARWQPVVVPTLPPIQAEPTPSPTAALTPTLETTTPTTPTLETATPTTPTLETATPTPTQTGEQLTPTPTNSAAEPTVEPTAEPTAPPAEPTAEPTAPPAEPTTEPTAPPAEPTTP